MLYYLSLLVSSWWLLLTSSESLRANAAYLCWWLVTVSSCCWFMINIFDQPKLKKKKGKTLINICKFSIALSLSWSLFGDNFFSYLNINWPTTDCKWPTWLLTTTIIQVIHVVYCVHYNTYAFRYIMYKIAAIYVQYIYMYLCIFEKHLNISSWGVE